MGEKKKIWLEVAVAEDWGEKSFSQIKKYYLWRQQKKKCNIGYLNGNFEIKSQWEGLQMFVEIKK